MEADVMLCYVVVVSEDIVLFNFVDCLGSQLHPLSTRYIFNISITSCSATKNDVLYFSCDAKRAMLYFWLVPSFFPCFKFH